MEDQTPAANDSQSPPDPSSHSRNSMVIPKWLIAAIGSMILILFFVMVYGTYKMKEQAPLPTFPSPTPTITIDNTTPNPTAVEGEFYGGIAGIPCSDGYSCRLEGNYPDAGGVCVKEVPKITPQSASGAAALQ